MYVSLAVRGKAETKALTLYTCIHTKLLASVAANAIIIAFCFVLSLQLLLLPQRKSKQSKNLANGQIVKEKIQFFFWLVAIFNAKIFFELLMRVQFLESFFSSRKRPLFISLSHSLSVPLNLFISCAHLSRCESASTHITVQVSRKNLFCRHTALQFALSFDIVLSNQFS